uniref:RRM domain-containing protein n=2 Tax=Physcomitrium patens TaxID=3218 RepID=A0A2K1JXI7_PHYPA|nr:hypothetical protein PHYPA_013362 [Physcomitrium patens]
MAQQTGGGGTGSGALGNQFGDTTYTKVFVGGLAWETQRDTMRRHFEQFGDILEAVVITDKNTGRSKGYGFVTFRDAESARKACVDATPIIDGRRANCNLASLGAHRHRPHGQHGPQQGGPGFTGAGSYHQPGSPYAHPSPAAFYSHYGGYPQYPQDYASYPPNLFQYGGPQYPQMYGAPGALSPGSGPVYPYGSFTTQPLQGGPVYPGTAQYGYQAPQLYGPAAAGLTTLAPPYSGSGSLPASTPAGGVSPSLSAGQVAGQVSPQQYAVPSGSQQQYSSGGSSEQHSGTQDVTKEASSDTSKLEAGKKNNNVVFVAGATGKVGSRTVRELLKSGVQVRAGVRDVSRGQAVLKATDKSESLEFVKCDLENDAIESCLGDAGVVVCTIGASEKEISDVTGPYRIDYKATENLIKAATSAKVNHFILVSSLGTTKFGWPASILNLFWGVLIWKAKAEKALEESGLSYTIVRPGGMERPTDAYKETHNLILAPKDTYSGGQVSSLQIAELIAACVSNLDLAGNKVLEAIAETTAPLRPLKDLLAEAPSRK